MTFLQTIDIRKSLKRKDLSPGNGEGVPPTNPGYTQGPRTSCERDNQTYRPFSLPPSSPCPCSEQPNPAGASAPSPAPQTPPSSRPTRLPSSPIPSPRHPSTG